MELQNVTFGPPYCVFTHSVCDLIQLELKRWDNGCMSEYF
jgi:hypothetical protein